MRIGIDYTSAARQGGGIGRYTRELVTAVLAEGADSYCEAAPQACQHRFVLFAGTQGLGDRWKTEAARLRRVAAPGQLTLRQVPLTDEWMARIWQRLRLPIPAELITGRLDLFYAPDFLLPPLLTARRKLITIHDLSFIRHPETFTPQLRRYLGSAVPRSARAADHILTDSHATRQDVIDLLQVSPERVSTLHLGVSAAFRAEPEPEERADLERLYDLSGAPFVLAVGTVQPRKNYRRLIDAVERIRERVDVDLVIVGGRGWLSDDLVEAAAHRPWVHLPGFAADTDLPALYRQAEVLAYPSLYEGFGLSPLEAMACGTPVVASTVSSVPEAVGDAGLLVDPLDVDGLANAIERAITDSALRSELRARGFARAATFTWARAARGWWKIVEESLARS